MELPLIYDFWYLTGSRLIYHLLPSARNLLIRIALLFFGGICFVLNGQSFKEGYIVTNENDTVRGFVKNKELSTSRIFEKVKFKKEKEGEEQSFSANQLKSFLCGIDLHVSRKTSLIDGVTQNVFMQVMVRGYLSYYLFAYTGLNSRSTYLTVDNTEQFAVLQKEGENIQFTAQVNHITVSFKKRMINYLKDDPALCKKIKKGIYTRNDVLKIVNDYNSHRKQLQPVNF